MGINKVIKVFSMVLDTSYHDEDSDSDHTHSYPLMVICYLPGTVQKPIEVAAIIPDVGEKTGTIGDLLRVTELGKWSKIQSQVFQLQSLAP